MLGEKNKKRFLKTSRVAVACLLVLLSPSTRAEVILGKQFAHHPYVEGEILVKYKSSVSTNQVLRSVTSFGAAHFAQITSDHLHHISLAKGVSVEEAVQNFEKDPDVEFAQPNYIKHILTVPNDPKYSQLWGLKNTGQAMPNIYFGPASSETNPGTAGMDMSLEPAWSITHDCSSVIVAVIDTGVNYNHQDLAANMWNGGVSYPHHGWNFVDSNNDPMDVEGHGTHVAGTIAAVGNNGIGTTGVCWSAQIMALRVGKADGTLSSADEIAAIQFAADHGAKVMNMSFGSSSFDQAEENALVYAQQHNVIAVIAAGNSGTDNDDTLNTPDYPCDYSMPNAICVAALNQSFGLASFSNYGPSTVDIGAPGVNIVSTAAGTQTSISDSASSGWTRTSTTATGWGYSAYFSSGGIPSVLADPSNYNASSAMYANSTDDRVYKSFNFSVGYDSLSGIFAYLIDLGTGDQLSVAINPAGGDPFGAGGTTVNSFSGSANSNLQMDLSSCQTATCSLGFRLSSDGSSVGTGAVVGLISFTTLSWNSTTYDMKEGTSMATPHVVGLAALVWSYNPQMTYSEVISAVTKGGVANSALNGLTKTGNSANALGALTYINPPSGVSLSKN